MSFQVKAQVFDFNGVFLRELSYGSGHFQLPLLQLELKEKEPDSFLSVYAKKLLEDDSWEEHRFLLFPQYAEETLKILGEM